MLANGDPVEGLADYLNALIRQTKNAKSAARVLLSLSQAFRSSLPQRLRYRLFSRKKKYFNEATHENDIFTEDDVRSKIQSWKKVLNHQLKKEKKSPVLNFISSNNTQSRNERLPTKLICRILFRF